MNQGEKAEVFRALHQRGTPLVLWNVWDAASTKAVTQAGAKAIATGSWSVAAALGFEDGEALPLDDALRVARQIVGATVLPVSVDFEGGYAVTPQGLERNVSQLIATGVVGLNFEDRVVRGEGLHTIEDQSARIAAIRKTADDASVPLFINARTDVFFQDDGVPPAAHMEEALERAAAYAKAGADGVFVPGLSDLSLIQRLAQAQPLPVNVMRMGADISVAAFAAADVSRVSHGPGPFIAAMKALREGALV
ncbi:isocitrate lyase/PEP mutase family protein [Sulfitobacter noctilucicola]|uniref:2-methylisocitrate lyase-like PEP mutase family enzyme n=1 Tax=Sulfitobacter noctilucicola TaxID=1342301 RepID=A0A7W6MAE5_9RHOB|nr:isocitrate lyase/phosphoenolpyruvate mutase family protein [Sulfitobacter noctilucicola]MBB4175334.1 2-methylisocitrate lyase-like PEP mutase family enzyme [Sulfitobacter noctilucicola]